MKRNLLIAVALARLAIGCAQGTEPLPVRVDGERVHIALHRRELGVIELYDLVAQRWLGVLWKASWTFGAVSEDGRIRYTDEGRPGIFILVADDPEELAEGADPGENDERVPTPGCERVESTFSQQEPPFAVSPSGELGYKCGEQWFIEGRALPSCNREGHLLGKGHVLGLGMQGAVFCNVGVVGSDGVMRAYSGLPEEVYVDRADEYARYLGVRGVRMGLDGMYAYVQAADGAERYARIDEVGLARPAPGGATDRPDEYRPFPSFHVGVPEGIGAFAPRPVRLTAGGLIYAPLVAPESFEGEGEVYRFYSIFGDEFERLEFPDVADVHYALQTP